MKFTLEIDLSSANMKSYADIGRALQEVGSELKSLPDRPSRKKGDVWDFSGHVVGQWRISERRTSAEERTK